jgi:hypothetical protein
MRFPGAVSIVAPRMDFVLYVRGALRERWVGSGPPQLLRCGDVNLSRTWQNAAISMPVMGRVSAIADLR